MNTPSFAPTFSLSKGAGKCATLIMLSSSLLSLAPATAKHHHHNLHLMSVNNAKELQRAVCMDAGAPSKLIIAKMHVIKKADSVSCNDGMANIRFREDTSDPGHVLVNIDPPKGSSKGLDCDGKADIGLHYIGLNCLQADMESSSHRSN